MALAGLPVQLTGVARSFLGDAGGVVMAANTRLGSVRK